MGETTLPVRQVVVDITKCIIDGLSHEIVLDLDTVLAKFFYSSTRPDQVEPTIKTIIPRYPIPD